MKLPFFILTFSLLLTPVGSGTVHDHSISDHLSSIVEEELYAEFLSPVIDQFSIKEGGGHGSGAVVEKCIKLLSSIVAVPLNTFIAIRHCYSGKTPRYITYCRLKIAC